MNGGVPQNTLHAEYVAFRRAFKRLHREWSMVNIRIGKDMSVRLSKPCEKCQNFLRAVGCSKVLYTINANTCATLHL
jgi:cytidine deaminase